MSRHRPQYRFDPFTVPGFAQLPEPEREAWIDTSACEHAIDITLKYVREYFRIPDDVDLSWITVEAIRDLRSRQVRAVRAARPASTSSPSYTARSRPRQDTIQIRSMSRPRTPRGYRLHHVLESLPPVYVFVRN